jgi:putative FmdB family regulatory protein
MPLYEYRCSKCGKTFEVLEKFSDAALTVHDGCGGQVERLISTSAFQFKGSGWYVNDYAKAKPAETSSKSESSDNKASDGKPA